MQTSNIFGTKDGASEEKAVDVVLVVGTNVSRFPSDQVGELSGGMKIVNCTGNSLELPNEVKVFDLQTSTEELVSYLKSENYLIKTMIALPTLPDGDIPPTFDIVKEQDVKSLFAPRSVVVDLVDAYWRTRSFVSGDRQFNRICGHYIERSELKNKYINCHSLFYDSGGEMKTSKSTLADAVKMICAELEDRQQYNSPSLSLACLMYLGVRHYMGDGQYTKTRD